MSALGDRRPMPARCWPNEAWTAALAGGGDAQRVALAELRRYLLRGLAKALASDTRATSAFLEDAAQDALLRILDRLPRFEGRSHFLTWATAIAIRVAMSDLRRLRWRDVSLDVLVENGAEVASGGATGPAEGQELRADQRAIVERLYRLIDRDLTDRQRRALLAELRGMPQAEIARRLGSNRNAIYKLTHDARKRLKRGLEAAGYEGDTVRTVFFS